MLFNNFKYYKIVLLTTGIMFFGVMFLNKTSQPLNESRDFVSDFDLIAHGGHGGHGGHHGHHHGHGHHGHHHGHHNHHHGDHHHWWHNHENWGHNGYYNGNYYNGHPDYYYSPDYYYNGTYQGETSKSFHPILQNYKYNDPAYYYLKETK